MRILIAFNMSMDTVVALASAYQELGGQPFLGLFAFVEQGCALLCENSHANFMMSIVVFEA